MNNGPATQIDPDFDSDSLDFCDDNPGDQGAFSGDFDELFNSDFLRPSSLELSLVDVDDEEDSGSTPWADPEYSEAAFRCLPDPRKKTGRGIKPPQPVSRVTAEDFPPGSQRKAFIFIHDFAQIFCSKRADPLDRLLAARWFFCILDAHEVDFNLACDTLAARPDVVRLRLMYELWNRWIVFSEPIPKLVVPVPDILFSDIQFHAGTEGHLLCQEAWEWPGISTSQLLMRAAGVDSLDDVPERFTQALHALDTRHILSVKENGWWMTGRNPELNRQDLQMTKNNQVVAGKTVTFSELFD